MAKQIEKIEKKIHDAMASSGSNRAWHSVARMLILVHDNKTWEDIRGIHSFTAWLKHLSQREGVDPTSYWRVYHAGRLGINIAKEWTDKALKIEKLEDIDIAPEPLQTVEKIYKKTEDRDLRNSLISGLMTGKIAPGRLRGFWADVKKGLPVFLDETKTTTVSPFKRVSVQLLREEADLVKSLKIDVPALLRAEIERLK